MTKLKLPVWSDEWAFGIKEAEVTSTRKYNGQTIVYVKIPGRKRRSKFWLKDLLPQDVEREQPCA